MIISEIDKNVKMPTVHTKFNYPWDKMELNDSVLIKAEDGESLDTLKKQVGPSARYYGNVTGKKFKALLMRQENGIRVWRVE